MSETLNSGHYGFFREILPEDNTTWADLATSPFGSWSTWTTWHPDPVDIEVQIDDDLGSIELRQPTMTLGKQGDLGIVLKISDTGTFTGEETTVDLSDGTAKDFVGGQHYRFVITVGTTVDVALPSVAQIDVNYTSDNIVEELKNAVDVPSTATDSSGYTLIDNNLGLIQNVQATALQGGLYVTDGYVLSELANRDYYRTGKTITNSGTTFTTEAQFGTHSFQFADEDSFTVPQDSQGEFMTNGEDFTVEFWIYIPTGASMTSGTVCLLPKSSFGGNPLEIYVTTSPSLEITANIWNSTTGTNGGSASLSYDTWQHIALTYDGSSNSMNFFVDGSQEFAPTLGGVFEEVSTNLQIGDPGTDGFEGYIDELRWSNSQRYTGSSFTVPTQAFINDPNTLLLLHADNDFTDDGGIEYSQEEYFVTQYGGIAMVQTKNPLSITVTDYNGSAWDGTVDLVLRGVPKIQQTDFGIDSL